MIATMPADQRDPHSVEAEVNHRHSGLLNQPHARPQVQVDSQVDAAEDQKSPFGFMIHFMQRLVRLEITN